MSYTVCLNSNTLAFPTGGGHRWVYLNWALGLVANGCRVIWMEGAVPSWGSERIQELIRALKDHLRPYGLADSVAIYSLLPEQLPEGSTTGCMDFGVADSADLLLDIAYGSQPEVVSRFRRSVMIDIDPGILQVWVAAGHMKISKHDVYCTIGETVGRSGSNLPDVGIPWHYLPPCVSLEHWPVTPLTPGAPFTTVSQWRGGEWIVYGDESYSNEKRDGFLPYLDLPRLTHQPLELALGLGEGDVDQKQELERRGWRVRHASSVTSSTVDYQKYISGSAGEFACCKPSCVKLQNAWISDRTLCYLASGRPAVVQHTGPSRFLPDANGLFRFKTPEEAARYLEMVMSDYPRYSAAARALAEEYFDAKKITGRLLEIVAK